MEDSDSIKIDVLQCVDGHTVGQITLNKPKALNALDLFMAQTMLNTLLTWQPDDNMVCVVICGEGDKAFCAGGDVVSMYHAMRANPDQTPKEVEQFFTTEYKLDYLIHTYQKPVIAVGQGFVMGGGMGIFCAASHKLVTPSSRLAMPEITIGLYPDVGGTYFLPRLPAGVGLFLGLTGAAIAAADGVAIGLVKHVIADAGTEALVNTFCQHHWTQQTSIDKQVDDCISACAISIDPSSRLADHGNIFEKLSKCQSVTQAATVLQNLNATDKWLARAVDNFKRGSPITAHIVFEQLKRGRRLSLADCFRLELSLSCRCAASGEFEEGVRALLVDKDNAPRWKYDSVDSVPDEFIDTFFTSLWASDSHPLQHLHAMRQ